MLNGCALWIYVLHWLHCTDDLDLDVVVVLSLYSDILYVYIHKTHTRSFDHTQDHHTDHTVLKLMFPNTYNFISFISRKRITHFCCVEWFVLLINTSSRRVASAAPWHPCFLVFQSPRISTQWVWANWTQGSQTVPVGTEDNSTQRWSLLGCIDQKKI